MGFPDRECLTVAGKARPLVNIALQAGEHIFEKFCVHNR